MHPHFRLPYCSALVSLTLLAATGLHADVTLRYQTEVKANPGLPARITQQMAKGMAGGAGPSIQQFKNGKGFTSTEGMTCITDFTKQEITMLDTEGKRYATLPMQQMMDEIVSAMPAAPAAEKEDIPPLKSHFESKAAGGTATIQGIEGEEHVFVVTMDGPALPNMPPGPMMRTVMHFWMAKKSEIMRVPAVREVAGYNLWAAATMNPVGMLEKMFKQMPGLGDEAGAFMASVTKEMQSGTAVALRVRMEIYMPMMAAMMKRMPAGQNPFGAGFDPDAPLVEMTKELAGISTDSIPDSVFQVPADYQPAPFADIFKGIMAKAKASAQ